MVFGHSQRHLISDKSFIINSICWSVPGIANTLIRKKERVNEANNMILLGRTPEKNASRVRRLLKLSVTTGNFNRDNYLIFRMGFTC
jgi:hypothetical protein